MTSRRTFITAAALAPVAIAAPAFAAIPASQHPDWLALLAEERRASDAFDAWIDIQDEAHSRYYEARNRAMEAWEQEWRARAGKPQPFIEARPPEEVGEDRVQAGIRDYNEFHQRMRAERDTIGERLPEKAALAAIDERYDELCDAHTGTIDAILSYPSRDPDIIAEKLRLIVKRHGDGNGSLAPLLASIVGEA